MYELTTTFMTITTATHSHRVTPRAPRGGALGARWIGARSKKRPLKKFKTEHARRFRCAFLLEVGVGLRPPEVSPGAVPTCPRTLLTRC